MILSEWNISQAWRILCVVEKGQDKYAAKV